MRYVRVSPAIDPERSPTIFADDASGVTTLARHLWSQGHRRFGVVAGPSDHAATVTRRDGFIRAIVASGGAPDDVSIVGTTRDDPLFAGGRHAAQMLLSNQSRPTAIFAFNDELALGVMAFAREIGLAIPQDLAVAGYDGGDIGSLVWPSLTSIRQPIVSMSAQAAEILAQPASAAAMPNIWPVELIVRGSTRPK